MTSQGDEAARHKRRPRRSPASCRPARTGRPGRGRYDPPRHGSRHRRRCRREEEATRANDAIVEILNGNRHSTLRKPTHDRTAVRRGDDLAVALSGRHCGRRPRSPEEVVPPARTARAGVAGAGLGTWLPAVAPGRDVDAGVRAAPAVRRGCTVRLVRQLRRDPRRLVLLGRPPPFDALLRRDRGADDRARHARCRCSSNGSVPRCARRRVWRCCSLGQRRR